MGRVAEVTQGEQAYIWANLLRADYTSQTEAHGGYHPYDRKVELEGTTWWVKNRAGATIAGDSSTYQEIAVQNALDGLSAGRVANEQQECVLLKGYFDDIGDTLEIGSYTLLQILGKLKLGDSVDKTLIKNADPTGGNKFINIDGIGFSKIDGNKANQSSSTIDLIDIRGTATTGILLNNLHLVESKRYGLIADDGDFHLHHVQAYHCDTGFYLEGGADDSKMDSLCGANSNTTCDLNIKASACNIHGYFGSASPNNIDMQSCDNNILNVFVDAAGEHNILLHYGGYHLIHVNARCPSDTVPKDDDDTWSFVYLSNSASVKYNVISGVFRVLGTGNRPKYAIEEAGSADYNLFSNITAFGYQTAGVKKVGANSKAPTETIIGTVV